MRVIEIILTKILEDLENKQAPETNIYSNLYPQSFLQCFTYIGHTQLASIKADHKLHIIFLQELFFIYGPE